MAQRQENKGDPVAKLGAIAAKKDAYLELDNMKSGEADSLSEDDNLAFLFR